MNGKNMNETRINSLLEAWNEGKTEALSELIWLMYEELRCLAGAVLRKKRCFRETIRPTVLVHEAYLKLTGKREMRLESRHHFFNVAALLMRRLISDYFRQKKWRSDSYNVDLPTRQLRELAGPAGMDGDTAVYIDRLFDKLKKVDPRTEMVASLKLFLDFKNREIAEALSISDRLVQEEWKFAKAWLKRELELVSYAGI